MMINTGLLKYSVVIWTSKMVQKGKKQRTDETQRRRTEELRKEEDRGDKGTYVNVLFISSS